MKLTYIFIATIAIVTIFLCLYGILILKQTSEGFSDSVEYPDYDYAIKNPLVKVVKKLGVLSSYFLNPSVWSEAYAISKMSAVELARKQLAKDKKEAGK